VYTLLGKQRSGATVYRGSEEYLRLGSSEAIATDLRIHRAMEKAKFPVARIQKVGTYEDKSYFVEKSLGTASFRALFQKDMEERSAISRVNFKKFLAVTSRFFKAQCAATESVWSPDEFASGINLPQLCKELPSHAVAIRNRFAHAVRKIAALPSALTHGDLNPANMYGGGVIDLEDSFAGPLGYDVISSIVSIEWSPQMRDHEFHAQYRFTDSEKAEYFSMIDTIAAKHVRELSHVKNELAFCRAVWLCVGMGEWPKIQQWRFEKFVKEYLS